MPFLDPATGHLNLKIALYGPDAAENARRLRAAHARSPGRPVLRQVHGDGSVFPPGATVLFFDDPIEAPPFHGHPLHMHLYAFEGAPEASHLSVLLLGVDGVVFVPGPLATTPIATRENLRAFLAQADHKLPTVLVDASPEEDDSSPIARVVAAVMDVLAEHVVDR